ncbi:MULTISPECIES: hypothetical protein [unclassified Leucobacter]|uniref:hypothetical protein n=1 Tax=unclassified Leucobacter TaxID=2621730 RepID=UPI00301956C3
MEKFTASNGTQVVPITAPGVAKGIAVAPDFGCRTNIYDGDVQALREFFQHERDQELGRWRFNAYLTVYEAENHQPGNRARAVNVLDDRTGRLHMRHEGQAAWRETNPALSEAAAAYFAAHPEPKQWHEAKPGEVWVAKLSTGPTFDEVALQVMEYAEEGIVFMDHAEEEPYELTATEITDARRIWPEVSDE